MIHGQVASSGTSGGVEAKGDFRFPGAVRTCLHCPPATHWAAEPTRDSAPRRPDRWFSIVQETREPRRRLDDVALLYELGNLVPVHWASWQVEVVRLTGPR